MKEGGIGGFEVATVYPLAVDDPATGFHNYRTCRRSSSTGSRSRHGERASSACGWTSRSAAAGRTADRTSRRRSPRAGCARSGARSRPASRASRARIRSSTTAWSPPSSASARVQEADPATFRALRRSPRARADPAAAGRRSARRAVLFRRPDRPDREARAGRRRGLRPRPLQPRRDRDAPARGGRQAAGGRRSRIDRLGVLRQPRGLRRRLDRRSRFRSSSGAADTICGRCCRSPSSATAIAPTPCGATTAARSPSSSRSASSRRCASGRRRTTCASGFRTTACRRRGSPATGTPTSSTAKASSGARCPRRAGPRPRRTCSANRSPRPRPGRGCTRRRSARRRSISKAEADQHFLSGINQLIGHGWPYSPPQAGSPGWMFYAAGVYSDKNPWWPVMADTVALSAARELPPAPGRSGRRRRALCADRRCVVADQAGSRAAI